MRLAKWCVAAGFMFGWLSVQAAVIQLNNGDRITGEIVATTDGAITLQSELVGELVIARNLVAAVTEKAPEPAPVEPVITPQVVAQAAEAALSAPKNWEGHLSLNSTFSRGNTNSQTNNFQAEYQLDREIHRYNADISTIREEKEGDTVKEQDRLNLGYNYLFSEKWFFALNSTLERDPVALLDHRVSLNPALGYDIWNSKGRKLNVQFGAGYSNERINDQDESGAQVDWRLNYSQQILDGAMKVFHKHKIYQNLSGRENVVFISQTGLRYDLSDRLFMNVQLNYDYDTEPAAGTDSEDMTFLVGAGMSL